MYDDLLDAFMDALDDAPSDADFIRAAKVLQASVLGRDAERRTPKRPVVDHTVERTPATVH